MKKIKNVVLALAVVLATGYVSNAQMMRAGLRISPSLPIGDFAKSLDEPDGFFGAGFGIGGQIFADYFTNENFHVGIEAGYLSYSIKDYDFGGATVEVDENYTMIPLQLTSAYHTDAEAEFDFYVGTGVGLFLFSSTAEGAESESYFGFTPRVGISLELSDALRLDANAQYAYIITPEEDLGGGVTIDTPNLSTIGLNLGVSFMLFD